MKAKATTPDKQPAGRDSAPEASKHEWRGGGVEEPAASAGPLSETPEAAATRAEGNAPVEASAEANRAHPAEGKDAPPARRHKDQHPPDPRDEKVIDELKRQAAVEEHAAARGGKVVLGPI